MPVKKIQFTTGKTTFLQIFIAVVLFLLAGVNEFQQSLIPQRLRMCMLLLLVAAVVLLVCCRQILNAELLFHLGVMILFLLFRNYRLNLGSAYEPLLYISVLMVCYCSDRTIKWTNYLIPMLRIAYVFYAVCTIVFYFTPSFYLGTVVNLFPETKRRLIEWYNSGCMAGLTSHYSVNAIYIANGLVIELSFLFGSRKIKKRQVLIVGLLAAALLLTGKRAHIIFAGAAFFVMYWYHSEKKTRLLKTLRIMIAGICAAAVLFSVFPAFGVFLERFQSQIAAGDVLTNRLKFWQLAVQKFLENPVFGIGWENFLAECYETLGVTAATHNIYLQLLCETGIVGFLVYVSWMLVHLSKAARLIKFARIYWSDIPDRIRNSLLFSLGFQVFFLLYGLTGNPLYDEIAFIPYIVACSIAIYYGKDLPQRRKVVDMKRV